MDIASPQPTLEHINPALLLPPLIDLRDRTAPDYLDYFHNQLLPDIRKRKVQVPLTGYREGDRVRIGDGLTRLQGALLAGLETVPVLVWPHKPDENQMVLSMLLANAMRRDMQSLELAAAYSNLLELNGWTQADLARALHVSPAHVAKVLAISAKLHPEAQELVAAGKLVPRAAYAISRLPVDQQLELARKAASLPMAVESVEEAVIRILGNGRKIASKPVKFRACGVSGAIETVNGDAVPTFKAFTARCIEVSKQIDRNPELGAVLPRLLRGEANGERQ